MMLCIIMLSPPGVEDFGHNHLQIPCTVAFSYRTVNADRNPDKLVAFLCVELLLLPHMSAAVYLIQLIHTYAVLLPASNCCLFTSPVQWARHSISLKNWSRPSPSSNFSPVNFLKLASDSLTLCVMLSACVNCVCLGTDGDRDSPPSSTEAFTLSIACCNSAQSALLTHSLTLL